MIEIYSPTIRRKEMDAVLTALVEDKIGPGERSEMLIQNAKEYLGFDYCIAVRSPAIALYIALKALAIEDGKEVIVSALSPVYYIHIIEALRLTPVFCDTAPSCAVIDKEHIQTLLSPRTQAIVLRHTLGFTPDTASIAELGLPVIEDCSQSFGTRADGDALLPSAGVFTLIGLEERDMLTAGGGALLFAMNRRNGTALRNLGTLPDEYALPDMNAAMAIVQLREAHRNRAKVKEIANAYAQASLRTRHKRFISRDGVEYNDYTFPLILESGMKDVKAYAKKKDIAVENPFGNTALGSGHVAGREQCPESYSLSMRTVIFPLYPRLTGADIEKVVKLIGTLP
ncbi:MAG: DegT/DnrJ/EryC1/StrS family aminotransferase [Treponema sp.]|jgi:dTDP-4-amino-4,6-dideoxygalactose transaminase|nr:DegT/DnrJ/EryC1/StrS family aminotransferase [Treponema sp.]